jgi:predicted phosphodiesterase
MRIAIVTDIHEDFKMLEKAYRTLKAKGYDLLICLGDITGYATEYYMHNPDANACIDLLRENADIVLAGNHDLFSSQRLPSYHLEKNIPENWYELTLQERYNLSKNTLWLYEEEIFPTLSPENEIFLKNLQEWCVINAGNKHILFSHFLQPDLAGVGRWFPYRVGELRPHFRFMEENNSILSFVGHCHPEGVTVVSKLFWSTPSFNKIKIKQKPKIVLCPPIVNSKNSSSCLIFDSLSNEIVPYHLD